jgi:hypothetical protein
MGRERCYSISYYRINASLANDLAAAGDKLNGSVNGHAHRIVATTSA